MEPSGAEEENDPPVESDVSAAVSVVILEEVASLPGASIGERLFLTPTHTEVEKYVNQSYIITCGAPYASNLSWTGPKGQIINATEGKTVHIQDRDGHYLSLVFETIERSHRGNYTCKGSSDKEYQQLTFGLIVVKPITFAGPLDVLHASVQNATESKAITVKCEVSGDPPPKVVWQFKGKALPQDDRLLRMANGLYIKNVSYQDEGVYQCRAFQVTKLSSSMESRQITLTVQHKPRWVHINNSEQDRAYGYTKGVANVTCQASARPYADYTWTRYNASLDNTTTNIIDEVDRSVLQVSMVDRSVLGPYECTANNSLGEIRKVVELVEGSKPSPPIRVSVVGLGVHSAQFHLHAVSKEQIIGYRIQFVKRAQRESIEIGDYQDVYTSNGVPYSIHSLEQNTEYSYRVATRNNAGLSDYSPVQTFRTRDPYTGGSALISSSLFTHLGFLLPFIVKRTM